MTKKIFDEFEHQENQILVNKNIFKSFFSQKHKIQKKGQQSETTNNQIKKYKNEISR